ncbi:hypothetical protein MKW98_025103 [Papaver atlanticum]|uniref:F-box domain-containing protein n=1 Tax=Papaver atlanticum TaxID=357466 RepID=A0AAD4S1F6_9MAGN|nr:hypothetical protein MKW98_025103 [Papaver atlanticum]
MDGNCGGNPPPNSLTEDLLIEILLWLPVASLLRFKTVCKNWRSIIGSSDFIHRHATSQNSTSKLGNFIFQYRPKHINHRDYKPYFFVLSSSLASRGSGDGGEDEEDYGQWSYKNLGVSPHLRDEDKYERYAKYPPQANMVGSCHGIICIHDPHLRDVILWNPATKLFRCLPKSLPLLDELGILQSEFVLFGFDCQTYDYKVLLITFFEIESVLDFTPKSKVQIYSLRSDSWKWCVDANLGSHSYKHNCENQGLYHNGSYYFVGKDFHTNETRDAFWRSTVGLSFNFSSESFRKIPVPDDTCRLNVIGGDQGKIVYITFVSNSTSEYISEVYEVYTMKDYDYSCTATNAENKKYSWSKLHRFTIDHPYGRYGPKAITKNGMFGFLRGYGGGLVFMNFLTGELKDIKIIDALSEGLGEVFRTDVYKESLVSVDSPLPSSSSS